MSVRQVARLRVVEKKAELFRFSDRALCGTVEFAPPSRRHVIRQTCVSRSLSGSAQTRCSPRVGSRGPALCLLFFPKKQSRALSLQRSGSAFLFAKFFLAKVGQRARLVCLSVSVEFSFAEKVPSQSALAHKLMRSGFFICQNFLRSHQGKVTRLSTLVVGQKNMRCQEHPHSE